MNPFLFFALSLKASLLSTGGFGNIPSLRSDLVTTHIAADKTFAEALAVGQVSPGPNGLWVISLGYLVGGLAGAFAALLAITLPPLLVLLWEKLYSRISHHPFVEGFMRGLSLAVVGVFFVVLYHLLGTAGFDLRTLALLTFATALSFTRRVPVVAIIGVGALLGLLPT